MYKVVECSQTVAKKMLFDNIINLNRNTRRKSYDDYDRF